MRKTLLFTVCSIVVLDSFISPAKLGVPAITVRLIAVVLFFIPYGLISAELGSTFPASGGIANWVERAFGEFPCVLVGWMYWLNEVFWMPAVFIAFSDWIKVAMLEYFLRIVQRAVAGRFRAQQRSAEGHSLAGEDAVLIGIADPAVLAEQIADLSAADTDISGRNIRIRADMTVELCHARQSHPEIPRLPRR